MAETGVRPDQDLAVLSSLALGANGGLTLCSN